MRKLFYTKAIGLDPQDYISLKRRAIIREEGENDEGAIAGASERFCA